MTRQKESDIERRKPNWWVAPSVIRVLTTIGLTDLSRDEVRQYAVKYNSHYGSPQARALRTLHRIGLTDLSDEEVNRYFESSKK